MKKARLRNDTVIRKSKSNFYNTRGITPKRETSGGAHFRGLAPGQNRTVTSVASRRRQCPI